MRKGLRFMNRGKCRGWARRYNLFGFLIFIQDEILSFQINQNHLFSEIALFHFPGPVIIE
jgi:hypothetical protein